MAAIRYRVAGLALLFVHLLLVGWLTLRPLDVMWVTAANLEPLAGIKADLALGPAEAARRIGEGLVLLAPLGVLLPLADARLDVARWASLVRTVAAGALVSLGIELLQTAVPGRVVDVDAVLLNTAGVALAHVAVVPAWRARLRRRLDAAPGGGVAGPRAGAGAEPASGRRRRRGGALRREDAPQGATPRIPRVGIAP
ncbi:MULTISPECIES: VanZ family protein [Streptomyces]|uniref:VanZ like family protein n=2 Tax=Streptomyces TaxID=1883 RepID=A0A1D8G5K9_9ACTN|nr:MULTISPECIES: VanZ family protein [Streptomyces]AOT60703.1 VanZ like family protein [Streptomyces rubrolavendulae]KAF0649541.1 membrane protein [Streptomyces fradiae ATCC 10745 = DSM 40063]OSY49931.1 VanZ like family protein [Streptomyces fradiae ATCC 10745 = DSM 40063]QEV13795.1 VanZ family protein [Streptomyces fradiae ATCC 10745 = DSM 40063]UQS30964.1 VanZ family protein [Streptomyces fradiae]